jgi:hypothetical protein
MRIIYFLIIFVCSFHGSLFAQFKLFGEHVEKSEEQDFSGQALFRKLLPSYDQNFCLFYSEDDDSDFPEYYIQFYSDSMIISEEIQIDLRYGKKGRKERTFESLILRPGFQYLLFTSYNHEKEDNNKLFRETINPALRQQVFDMEEISGIAYDSHFYTGNFFFDTSPDSSKFLIAGTQTKNMDNLEKINFRVYDSAFNIILNKNVRIPSYFSLSPLRQYEVDNKGNAYILYENKIEKKDKFPRNEQNEFAVLTVRRSDFKTKLVPVRFETFRINDIRIIHQNHEMYCLGLYSEKSETSVKGTFCMKLNIDSVQILKESISPFEYDFLLHFMNKRRAKRGRELLMFHLDTVLTDNTGALYLISEEKSEVSTYHTTKTGISYPGYQKYDDIIITKYQQSGDFSWNTHILKSQVDPTGQYASFYAFTKDSGIYILYNDHPNNLFHSKKDKTYSFSRSSESVLVLAKVNSTGKVEKKPLLITKKRELIPQPVYTMRMNEKTLLLPAQKTGYIQFLRINLNNM